MSHLMEEINSQMALLAAPVQIWVNWLMIVFLISIVFVWRHRPARFVLLAFVMTMLVAMIVFHFTRNIHLFALAHIVVWTPLLIYLFKVKRSVRLLKIEGPYDLWQILLMPTITISLLFDVRDLFYIWTVR